MKKLVKILNQQLMFSDLKISKCKTLLKIKNKDSLYS